MITWGPHGLDRYWDATYDEDGPRHYGLDGEPISMRHWGYLVESKRRILRQEYIGDYWISTVHIGIDHGWHSERPLIFETMVFKGGSPERLGDDVETRRYSTWQEALAGHEELLNEVRLLAQLDSPTD